MPKVAILFYIQRIVLNIFICRQVGIPTRQYKRSFAVKKWQREIVESDTLICRTLRMCQVFFLRSLNDFKEPAHVYLPCVPIKWYSDRKNKSVFHMSFSSAVAILTVFKFGMS